MNATALILSGVLMAPAADRAIDELAFLRLTDEVWQVWTMRADGTHARQITRSAADKMRASWYPDGNRLLVSGGDGKAYRVDLSSGKESPVNIALSGFQDAVLAPDGSRIAFSLSTSGSVDDHDIWVVAEDGSRPEKLTSMPWLQHEPSWSADGHFIYFLSGNGEQTHDIWRVSVSDRTTRQLTANQLYQFDVAVNSKGDMAFSSNRSGHYDIWIQANSGELRQLTDDASLDAHPAWSRDDSKLAFESTVHGESSVWVMNADGSHRMRVTDASVPARFPVWRPVETMR